MSAPSCGVKHLDAATRAKFRAHPLNTTAASGARRGTPPAVIMFANGLEDSAVVIDVRRFERIAIARGFPALIDLSG